MALSSETLKRAYWASLTIGTGGALFFLALAVASALYEQFGFTQFAPTLIDFSVSTVEGGLCAVVLFLVAIVAALMLRRSYRQHPGETRGPLHLPLADLLIVAIACGLVMAAMHSLWGSSGRLGCVIVTIFYGLLLALGFMLANAYRIPSGWRFAFAFALPLAVHGALSVGALVAGVLCVSILGQSGWLFLDFVLTMLPDLAADPVEQQYSIMAHVCGLLRAGVCVFPFTLFLCWVAWSQRPRSDTETTQEPHRKALAAQEALGWVGLTLGLGGLALCIASHFSYSFHYRPTAWGWALGTAGIAIGSGWLLLRAFWEARRQGYTPRVGLLRLLFAAIVFISLNVGMHLLGVRLFVSPGDDPLTVLLGHVVTLAAGLILAGRSSWKRLALAFGLMPLALGALATGALALRFVEATCQSGLGIALADTSDVLTEIRGYCFLPRWPSERFLSWVLRYGLYMLPIGALLCWLASSCFRMDFGRQRNHPGGQFGPAERRPERRDT